MDTFLRPTRNIHFVYIQGVPDKMQPMFLAATHAILIVSLILFPDLDKLGDNKYEFMSV